MPASRTFLSSVLTGVSAAVLLSSPGLAQDQDQDASEGILEEIIVTTQKREQSLRDVPITVTAYSGSFMETIGIGEFDELSDFVPGLIVQEQSPNNPGFVIRGITSDSGSALIAPRVSIYLNGVDVSRSRGSYFDLFDIERVEVVKGPQSTLFGTAASIGAISVVTRRPQKEFEGEFNIGYGNFSYVQSDGFVTGGTDNWQARLAWQFKKREGYVDNIAGEEGSQSEGRSRKVKDLNGLGLFALRPSLRLTPNERLTVDVVVNYQSESAPATAFTSGTLAPTGGDTSPFTFTEISGSPDSIQNLGDDLGLEREVWDLNVTLDWDWSDTVTFTSITGLREFDSLEIFDADGSQANFLEFAEDADGDQFSQEIRFNYDDGGKLTGFFGFNFFHEDGTQRVPFTTEEGTFFTCAFGGSVAATLFAGLGLPPSAVPPCLNPDGSVNSITPILSGGVINEIIYTQEFTNSGNFDTTSFYADATYAISPEAEFTAGVRYVHEKRKGGFQAISPASTILTLAEEAAIGAGLPIPPGFIAIPILPAPDTGGQFLTRSRSFDAWLPRFNLRVDASDDISFYGTVAKGRRSPVFNENFVMTPSIRDGSISVLPGLAGAIDLTDNVISAESIWNYEGGVKLQSADGRFSGQASVYYQEYSNFQVTITDPQGSVETIDAGNASNIGVELEATGRIADGLELFGTLAYIDAQIDDKEANGDFAGDRFRLQPKWSSSIGFHYERYTANDMRWFLTGTWTYRSSVFFEQPNNPAFAEDAISLFNLRGGFGTADGRYTVRGFVTNLFDKNFIIDAGNTGAIFGTPTFIAGPPRFFGVELGARF